MCLLKNNVIETTKSINGNDEINGVDSSLEMEDCNQTTGKDTSSDQDCSVIVVDD